MKDLSNALTILVEAEQAGQRIDNFIQRLARAVPKSHIHRVIRKGEVRVNSGRIDASYRIQIGDRVRIPPIRTGFEKSTMKLIKPVNYPTVFEDDALLVINKPAGVAVHGGSGVSFGVIESLRAARPDLPFLELVHRLDRETSGVLLLAKRRAALVSLHEQIREGEMSKSYLALVRGVWTLGRATITLPLRKHTLDGGDRRVSVDSREGKAARTDFQVERQFQEFSLLRAILHTGRTHQIRVHLAHSQFPILGDDKYGDFVLNRKLRSSGVNRMFLHAEKVILRHPVSQTALNLVAPMPMDMSSFLYSIT